MCHELVSKAALGEYIFLAGYFELCNKLKDLFRIKCETIQLSEKFHHEEKEVIFYKKSLNRLIRALPAADVRLKDLKFLCNRG